MKFKRKLIIFMVVGFIFEICVLYYIDRFYLSKRENYTIELVEKNNLNKNFNITVPKEAKNIKLSHDGKYISYYFESKLYITDTETGKENYINFDDVYKLSYYKWLSDRNRMLLIENKVIDDKKELKLSYYDSDNNVKKDVFDFAKVDNKSYVSDIQMSTLTNIIYIKVNHVGDRCSIYRIDISNNIQRVKTKHFFINNIAELVHEDKLIYEDDVYHNIFVVNNILKYNKKIQFQENEGYVLIGVDKSDNIYVGKLQNKYNNKIVKIYYGNYKTETSNWNSIKLDFPTYKSNIYIQNDGTILEKIPIESIIVNLNDGKKYKYKGAFLQIYDKGIASIFDSKLIKTEI
ncbi:hypothetical protein CLTEP_24830 [Clostridium tepidiprofundi DSM 19306]|uniref:Dipeptidyl-peptidase IV n=1 Tax=Clostridium tepidiprofundi DSM 19306 TaxID=1121338 RepID=A0A151ATF3_9CLOT|nr:hypothetical protein [Clostridium tepidiprofundi]KYH30830.1 hypothetical protein CLTEP_24830 [Clostridium tepidiprofundi DSM 19306]